MFYIVLILIFFLLLVIYFLIAQNARIKQEHLSSMMHLQDMITTLHFKQQELNQKILISEEYKLNYSKDMKVLGNEVLQLQKVFIDIISDKKI